MLGRKVNQVERHDGLCATRDRRGEHMPVVGVGKLQPDDDGLPVFHHRVVEGGVHQSQRSVECRGIDVPLRQNVPTDFIEDRVGPQRPEQVLFGDREQGVPQDIGEQNARIQHDGVQGSCYLVSDASSYRPSASDWRTSSSSASLRF